MARPLATDMVEWTDENGNVHEVTRALRVKLLQPYRGQKMSDLEKEVLRFFKDVPVRPHFPVALTVSSDSGVLDHWRMG